MAWISRGSDSPQVHQKTPTYKVGVFCVVGMLGIEPSLHAPEACVLPVYYIPK